jgi:uncharacterized repeat protein (TIGR01451 family)
VRTGTRRPPVITSAQTGANQVDIQGRLTSNPNSDFTIQFFANAVDSPPGREQGQTFIGSITVSTDPSGVATFSTRLSGNVAAGQFLTAIATESGSQNSSEFSADVPITPAPVTDLAVTVVANPADNLLLGAQQTYTFTVTNNGPQAATGVRLVSSLDTNSTFVNATTTVGTITRTAWSSPPTSAPRGSASRRRSHRRLGQRRRDDPRSSRPSRATRSTPTATNNTAVQVVNVLPAADLAVTINPAPEPGGGQRPLTYVITVTNNGPSVATTSS